MSDTLVLALAGIGLVLIAMGALITWRRSSVRAGAIGSRPRRMARGSSRPGEERQAAAASEAIEDLVNQRLAAIPGLATTRVDFGTLPDGSLEIWVGDERYTSVEDIRDQRIRQAVAEAVASFNR